MAESRCDPNYHVKFLTAQGRTIDSPTRMAELRWGRKLDGISEARITYVITEDSCCEELGKIEPVAHQVAIYRDQKLVWYGWVRDVEYTRGSVVVDCVDALWWLTKRVIRSDITWTNTDLSTIFLDLWNDAILISPITATVVTTPTGTYESRETKANQHRIAWNIVREMLDAGLDVTTVGNTVVAGVISNKQPIELKLTDIQGEVSLRKTGSLYANRVIADASETIQATYPTTPASANSLYPLVEEVIKDSQIADVQSALNAARARYEYKRIVPRIVRTQDGLMLQPNIDIHVSDLVCGATVIVDTYGLCYDVKQSFRLGNVNVVMAGGVEKIDIGLQPVGPLGSLSDAEDPVL